MSDVYKRHAEICKELADLTRLQIAARENATFTGWHPSTVVAYDARGLLIRA
jgi:hypothetical protein